MSQQQTKKSNSNLTTIMVALVLCLVCSIVVSAVAVGLKPAQLANQQLDLNKNILVAAGLFDPETDTNEDVESRFEEFDVRLVDLKNGTYATDAQLEEAGISDVANYDANQAAKNQALSTDLGDNDPASIGRVPNFGKVYVKNDANGNPELVVLPVHGYGLWGTIYGFLTLEGDLNTVKGISWYAHKETPGLGARIEEKKWRDQFEGVDAYNEQGDVALGVGKGQPIDGISGATLTSRGVNNLIQFWLGEQGYKPFLDNLRDGSMQTGMMDDVDKNDLNDDLNNNMEEMTENANGLNDVTTKSNPNTFNNFNSYNFNIYSNFSNATQSQLLIGEEA